MDFRVIVDASLVSLGIAGEIDPNENKRLLSLINDFEDGNWRRELFDNFIWDNIADTALSHREREALVGQPHSLLVAAAKNLRLSDSDQDISKPNYCINRARFDPTRPAPVRQEFATTQPESPDWRSWSA